MQREPFLRMRFFASLFAATFLASAILGGCSDADRVQVDFRKRIESNQREKQQPEATLNVAIASMISPNETIGHYHALLEYIAARVGRKINLVQRKTYAEINELLANGDIDLAFICSGPYAADKDRNHFEALAAPQIHQKAVYRAYLITGLASPVNQFEDLRGKVFAFSDPDSNAGCIVPLFCWLKGVSACSPSSAKPFIPTATTIPSWPFPGRWWTGPLSTSTSGTTIQ